LENGDRVGLDHVVRYVPSEYPQLGSFPYPTDGIIVGIDGCEYKCKDDITVELIAKSVHTVATIDDSIKYTVSDVLDIDSIYEVRLFPKLSIVRKRPEKSRPQDKQHVHLLSGALTRAAFWSLLYPDFEEDYAEGENVVSKRIFHPLDYLTYFVSDCIKRRIDDEGSLFFSPRYVNNVLFRLLHAPLLSGDVFEIIRAIRSPNEHRTSFMLHKVPFNEFFLKKFPRPIEPRWGTHYLCMTTLSAELVHPTSPIGVCKKIVSRGYSVSLRFILQCINRFELQHVGHFSYAYPQYNRVLLDVSDNYIKRNDLMYMSVIDCIIQFAILNPMHTAAYDASQRRGYRSSVISPVQVLCSEACDRFRRHKNPRLLKSELLQLYMKPANRYELTVTYELMDQGMCLIVHENDAEVDHVCVYLEGIKRTKGRIRTLTDRLEEIDSRINAINFGEWQTNLESNTRVNK